MEEDTCLYRYRQKAKRSCLHPPLEGDKDNYCLHHSRNDDKDKDVFWTEMQGKLHNKDFDFEGYYFPPGLKADFSDRKFIDANFSWAVFNDTANFSDSEFSGDGCTSFREAEFKGEGDTSFIGAVFSGKVGTDFSVVRFSGNGTTYFSDAKFFGPGITDFRGARFSGKGTTMFQGTEFAGEGIIDFSWAVFSAENGVDFFLANFSKCGTTIFMDTKFNVDCKFLHVSFPCRPNQFILFRGSKDPIDLSKCSFLYCNTERLVFQNCKFIENEPEEFFGYKLWKRGSVLYDENIVGKKIEPLKTEKETIRKWTKVDYSHVESLYRQFKKNLEEERDWEDAGEFHYGEMECKRRGLTGKTARRTFLRQNFGLLAWYRYVSGYGERPLRTLVSLALLIILCSLFYWLPGFVTHYITHINLAVVEETTEPYHGMGHWLWYSIKSAFLCRFGEHCAEPSSVFGKGVFFVESALGPTLIALFILALRRRLRR